MKTEPFETQAIRALVELRRDIAEMGSSVDLVALEELIAQRLNTVGAEMVALALKGADTTSPEITVDGEAWGNRRVSRGAYQTTFGRIDVERSIYQRGGQGRVTVPIELRLGIMEGYTPKLARILTRGIAVMTDVDAEGFLREVGIKNVSSATLNRIPKQLAARYEAGRAAIESAIREQDVIPIGAVTVQVGIDGVMVPQDGEHIKARGRKTSQPALSRHEAKYGVEPANPADTDGIRGRAWHEGSVGTIAFFDEQGTRLKTLYTARMPEQQKATTVEMLETELQSILKERSELNVVFASDGALAQWKALEKMKSRLPPEFRGHTMCLLDAFHAGEYIQKAADAIRGVGTGEAKVLATTWRETLKECDDGAGQVIRSMRGMLGWIASATSRTELSGAIAYLANQRESGRTDYAEAKARNYPIGTGITEAAAKTVVATRMKRAGARFSQHGGQTVMLFRTSLLSERFEALHEQLRSDYTKSVQFAL